MQICWTVAYRAKARPRERAEHVALFVNKTHVLPSPGASTDRGLLPRAGEEAASVDRQSLLRRAEAAAKSAALRYSETCGGAVRCTFAGQPRDQYYESFAATDCVADPQVWIIPRWADRIRLAFRWDIFEEDSVIPTESDFSVVDLRNAEQQAVPLPASWGHLLGALANAASKSKGAH